MKTIKENKRKWVITGVISLLAISVMILGVMLFNVEKKLGAISETQRSDIRTEQPLAATTPKSKNKTHVFSQNPTPGQDWFWESFDPDNWDPFTELQHMRSRIDKMFQDSVGRFGMSQKYQDLVHEPAFSPSIDVREENKDFLITVDLPGVEDGKLDVNVEGKAVTVSGQRDKTVSKKDDNGKVIREKRLSGEFSRTITLPQMVDAGKMKIGGRNGVFTITLPKQLKGSGDGECADVQVSTAG